MYRQRFIFFTSSWSPRSFVHIEAQQQRDTHAILLASRKKRGKKGKKKKLKMFKNKKKPVLLEIDKFLVVRCFGKRQEDISWELLLRDVVDAGDVFVCFFYFGWKKTE
jgi:hypothetical protein